MALSSVVNWPAKLKEKFTMFVHITWDALAFVYHATLAEIKVIT